MVGNSDENGRRYEWHRLPMMYGGNPLWYRRNIGMELELAQEDIQLARLAAIPDRDEPLLRAVAELMAPAPAL